MPCGGGCGGGGQAVMAAKDAWNGVPKEMPASGVTVQRVANGRGGPAMDIDSGVQPVRMEYTGKRGGLTTYPGARGSNRKYRASVDVLSRFHNVHPGDVETLLASGEWRRVGPPPALEPVQAPVKVAPEKVEEPVAEAELVRAVAVGEAVEVAPAVEQSAVVQTADGPVKRKRGAARKATGKQSELKDLPPLDG